MQITDAGPMPIDPYAPPESNVNSAVTTTTTEGATQTLATRGSRLLAAWVDGFVLMPFFFGLVFAVPEIFLDKSLGSLSATIGRTAGFIGLAIGLPILLLQARRYLATGQSFGKAALKIKVVRNDGGVPNMQTLVLRAVLFTVLSYIPMVGGLISLVDTLSIFGAERLCLHDRVASTKVVMA